MYRRENLDRKIIEFQRMLAVTDDQLTVALLKMAIESVLFERNSLASDRKLAGEVTQNEVTQN